jgi:hypothetical protein
LTQKTLSLGIDINILQPYARAFDVQSAPLAFLAAVLIIFGISDLVAVSMPEDIARHHWGTQGMLHLTHWFDCNIADFYL